MNLSRNYEGCRSVGNSRQKKKKRKRTQLCTPLTWNLRELWALKLRKKDFSPTTDCYGDKNESWQWFMPYTRNVNPLTSPLEIFHWHFQVKFLVFTYKSVKLSPPLKKNRENKKKSVIVIVSKSKTIQINLYSS